MNENRPRQNIKQELKIVFSPELNEELRFCFYAEQLEKIIYRPVNIDGKKWQCSCGFANEEEVCPSCGMQKNLAFGKINASYLERHRRERLAMMSGLVQKSRKPKKQKTRGFLVALVAIIIISAAALTVFAIAKIGGDQPVDNGEITDNAPDSTSGIGSPDENPDSSSESGYDQVTGSDTLETKEPETTSATEDTTTQTPPDTTDLPGTTETDKATQPPDTASPPDTTSSPNTTPNPPESYSASGNSTMGGRVYSAEEYDYIAKDGISAYDKNGKFVKNITENKADFLCGYGKIIFYANDNGIFEINLETGKDTSTYVTEKPSKMAVAHNTLYYCLPSDNTLYSMDGTGGKKVYAGNVIALEESQGKLYFSAADGLYRVKSNVSEAENINSGGAMCSFIAEMDNLVFYTVWNQLMAYRESDDRRLGVYGLDGNNYTAIMLCGNRVYYRAESQDGVKWYETDILFTYKKDTGVTTKELYITSGGLYDGNLNFVKTS